MCSNILHICKLTLTNKILIFMTLCHTHAHHTQANKHFTWVAHYFCPQLYNLSKILNKNKCNVLVIMYTVSIHVKNGIRKLSDATLKIKRSLNPLSDSE